MVAIMFILSLKDKCRRQLSPCFILSATGKLLQVNSGAKEQLFEAPRGKRHIIRPSEVTITHKAFKK